MLPSGKLKLRLSSEDDKYSGEFLGRLNYLNEMKLPRPQNSKDKCLGKVKKIE